MDANVATGYLSGPQGGKVAVIRWMGTTFDGNGDVSYVDGTDLPDGTEFGWGDRYVPFAPPGSTNDPNGHVILSGTIVWDHYRTYNTNPGDGTYSWSTPNLYLGQYGYSGSDGLGPYLTLSPTDNGKFFANVNQALAYGNVAVELVSRAPHGLKSGQIITTAIFGATGIPTIGTTLATSVIALNGSNFLVFVTGPTTAIVTEQSGIGAGSAISRVNSTAEDNPFSANAGIAGTVTTVNGSTAIVGSGTAFTAHLSGSTGLLGSGVYFGSDTVAYQVASVADDTHLTLNTAYQGTGGAGVAYKVGFVSQMQQPRGQVLPYTYCAAACSQLGCHCWINVPIALSDAGITALANQIAANLTPGLEVWIELGNEHWNDTNMQYYGDAMAGLQATFPNATPLNSKFSTTSGQYISNDQWFAARTARCRELFLSVFTGLGRTADVKILYGTEMAATNVAAAMTEFCTYYGVPMDYVNGANYIGTYSGDASVLAAFSPASASGSPGNAPTDAICDFTKHAVFYNSGPNIGYNGFWAQYSQNAAILAAWGQPPSALNLTVPSMSGGSLPPGPYFGYFTWVDTHGNETSAGNSQSVQVNIAAGYELLAAPPTLPGLPFLPTWAVGWNLYLTPAYGLPGSEVLYAGGATPLTASSYTCISGTWANPGRSPPSTSTVNLGSAPPRLIAYEGAVQTFVDNATPGGVGISKDVFNSPLFHDVITWHAYASQQGDPNVANSGCLAIAYFQLCQQWGFGAAWSLSSSTAVPAGYGLSNLYTTAQGGAPADGIYHDASNQSPGVQALKDWVNIMPVSDFGKPASPALQMSNPLATGLIRCVPIIEGAGSNLADYSGFGADMTTRQAGTTTALTWGTDATYGAWVAFNGSNQDAIATDVGMPISNGARTVMMLVKSLSPSSLQYFQSYGTNGASVLSFGTIQSGGNNAYFVATQGISIQESTLIDDGNFHWIGYTYGQASGFVYFYLDGVQVYGGDSLGPNTVLSGTSYLGQGGSAAAGPAYFNGQIAGYLVWDQALSPASITTFMGQPWALITGAGAPVNYTLTGPTTGLTGTLSADFTLTPAGTVGSDTVALAASTGTFKNLSGTTITSLTFTSSAVAQQFTYTPASVGAKVLTLTSADGGTVAGSPWTYTATAPVNYALTGPTSGPIGVASTNFTLTPSASETDTVSLSDGVGGLFHNAGGGAITTLVFSSSAAQVFTYTPGSAGAKTITLISLNGNSIGGSPATYTPFAPATGYAIGGSTATIVNVASGAISFTPNGYVTGPDTVTPSDGGAGGAFTPSTLTFSNTSNAQTATYLSAEPGTVTFTAHSSGGLAFSPASEPFSVLPNTVATYQSFMSGFPTGVASSIVITPQVFTGSAIPTPSTATAGTPVETTTKGSYWCSVYIHLTDSAFPSVPSIEWAYGTQTAVDPNPIAAPVATDSSGRVIGSSTLVDAVQVETGINLAQAISIIAAATAGESTGVLTGTPNYQAVGNPGTNRIAAIAAAGSGNRSSVVLTLPEN